MTAKKFVPLIKFIGKRTIPKNLDHTPKVHPMSGLKELPKSFFSNASASQAVNAGVLESIMDLPAKFRTPGIDEYELEQVNSGAAEIIY